MCFFSKEFPKWLIALALRVVFLCLFTIYACEVRENERKNKIIYDKFVTHIVYLFLFSWMLNVKWYRVTIFSCNEVNWCKWEERVRVRRINWNKSIWFRCKISIGYVRCTMRWSYKFWMIILCEKTWFKEFRFGLRFFFFSSFFVLAYVRDNDIGLAGHGWVRENKCELSKFYCGFIKRLLLSWMWHSHQNENKRGIRCWKKNFFRYF